MYIVHIMNLKIIFELRIFYSNLKFVISILKNIIKKIKLNLKIVISIV
jgi:hypothetical protein